MKIIANLGISLKYAPRGLLSTNLLEEIAIKEQVHESTIVSKFFDSYSKLAPDGFLDKCRELWDSEKIFSFPQPGLRKNLTSFTIHDDPRASKRLSSTFNKRVLVVAKVNTDNANPPFPSVPFGYISEE